VGGRASPGPVTIATAAPPEASFDALRALGIRQVLGLRAAGAEAVAAGCATRTLCLRGGATVALAGAGDPRAALAAALDRSGWARVVLTLDGAEAVVRGELERRAADAAAAIVRAVQDGRRFVVPPREHLLWNAGAQPRLLALRLAPPPPGDAAAAQALSDFAAALASRGLPFSLTLAEGAAGPSDCVVAGPGAPPQATAAPPPCRVLSRQPVEAESASAGGTSAVGAGAGGAGAGADILLSPFAGAVYDGGGRLIRGEIPLAAADPLLTGEGAMRDGLIVAAPVDYGSSEARAATLDHLERLARLDGTRVLDVRGFVATAVAPDPVLDRLRRAHGLDLAPPPDEETEREALRADARLAWRFFERFSIDASGLCADTAHVGAGSTWLHGELTMWDLGSLIAAVMSAHELGLIDDLAYSARARQLVRALPVVTIAGLRLPAEVIDSGSAAPLSGNFNACDTGRLLAVLRNLDAHPMSQGLAAPVVARWDLEGVIRDGQIHSVVGGRHVPRMRSHCAHYTARALRAWGHGAGSPYEVALDGSPTDRDMRLLHAAAEIGPIGAEPLLLEGLEMGFSPPAALLARVLDAAQRDDHAATGVLRAVSEAPLDRAPWFTYQGLALSDAVDAWRVDAVAADPAHRTPEFRRETALVNTKAAYLWAALHPSAHAARLVRHVRAAAAQPDLGFAPGVFAATGRGMPGYVDVNTNGIVLSAIAHLLRGRRPASD
jgi:hypothetical protein